AATRTGAHQAVLHNSDPSKARSKLRKAAGPLPARLKNDTTMKKLIFTTFLFFSLFTVFGQNGLKNGNLFILLKDKNTISINSYINNSINQIKTFPITEKSIYTTDQKERIVVLDTAKNKVTIYNIKSGEIKLTIPFDIKPKSIFIDENNLFIGGEKGKEILIQYHLKNEKWYQLEIPSEVVVWGKAIDDIVVNDSLLIAIDNIVLPKYVLFYRKNSTDKLELLHFKELKHNGAYESIHQGRITETYIGLLSDTYSGYVGATNHITVYNNLDLSSSFALSSNQNDKNYHTFTDFILINDKIVIASKEKGLGIFEIKESYFKKSDEYSNRSSNRREDISKIKYTKYDNQVITKLTLIPNTNKIVLTLEDKKGVIRHEIIAI
ncbi:hypothetical protein SAMN02927937_02934, partial [Paenimyroides aquimaris]